MRDFGLSSSSAKARKPHGAITEGALLSFVGFRKPWSVKGVNLEVAESQVKITVEYQGAKVECPKCLKMKPIKDFAPSLLRELGDI